MKIALSVIALSLVPVLAQAQQLGNIRNIVTSIGDIVSLLIPIAFAVALLFFFWGLAKFILASGSEEAKAEGKNIMIWGIIALFVMAAIWGIVAFLGEALDVDVGGDQDVPSVNIQP